MIAAGFAAGAAVGLRREGRQVTLLAFRRLAAPTEAAMRRFLGRTTVDAVGRRGGPAALTLFDRLYFGRRPAAAVHLSDRATITLLGEGFRSFRAAATADAVASALARRTRKPLQELIVSGPGLADRRLMKRLEVLVWPAVPRPSTVYGLPPLAKDAAAAALRATEER